MTAVDPKMVRSVSEDIVNILRHWQPKWKVSAFVNKFTKEGAYHEVRGLGMIKKTDEATVMAAISKLVKNGVVKYVHPSRRGHSLLTLTQQEQDS